MITVLAHGGWAGIAVEVAAAVGIVALGLAFWIGNRGERGDEDT